LTCETALAAALAEAQKGNNRFLALTATAQKSYGRERHGLNR